MDWWLELSVRDAKVEDAVEHLKELLDLAKSLVTSSTSGQVNALDGWLTLDELERVAIDCRNRAKEFLTRVHFRGSNFFSAVGNCSSSEMDHAVAKLIKAALPGLPPPRRRPPRTCRPTTTRSR